MINNCMESNTLPFLSHISHLGEEYLCIILNADEKILSFYDIERIRTPEDKATFLKLGDVWWHESNRLLPINIFLREEMKKFRECLRTVNRKDVNIISGPCTSLNDLIRKRVKKRQITLVKRIK